MADVQPVSLRFVTPELTGEVPSPPHDALSLEARQRHLAQHPRSYLGVTLSPEDMEPGAADPAEAALSAGRHRLETMLAEGVFGPATEPGFFIYRLEVDDHRQTGLVCGVATSDYDEGMVRIHEHINRGRADHLARHLSVVGAQSSPIAMAFKLRPTVVRIMDRTADTTEPLLDFVDGEGLRQQLWAITDPYEIAEIEFAFSNAALYLIDGHHRAAAASTHRAAIEPSSRDPHLMLSTLFPFEQLRNQAFHRILTGVDPVEFQAELARRFATRRTDDPHQVSARGPAELALGVPADGDGGATGDARQRSEWPGSTGAVDWLLLDVPFDLHARSDLDNIDPVRLARLVLGPILGIDEANSDPRLSYRPGLADAESIADIELGSNEMVFLMRPVPMDILMDASDEGLVMPPKSTYFLPKVRSGLFVRMVDEQLG